MPQEINHRKVFSLSEVAASIKRTLSARYGSRFWVKAEMNKLNRYDHSGHCYPDLIERSEGRIVAQMRAIIWAADFRRISRAFVQSTGEELADGMSILFEAAVGFDPMHGLSLTISDIDPSFTIGELEMEKRRCIAQLQAEGLWNKNKSLNLPFLPKRLAIISVSTSKGYADFLALLQARSRGFSIDHMLFPAILQGEKAVEQITARLQQIRSLAQHFDLVAIIRGGGGETGLSAFNHYKLAAAVAAFPLPVMTGIGHATNLTVTEMVAHTHGITPSELADMLLERFELIRNGLDNATIILKGVPEMLTHQCTEVELLSQRLAKQARHIAMHHQIQLNHTARRLHQQCHHLLFHKRQQLNANSDFLNKLSGFYVARQKSTLVHLHTRLMLACGALLGKHKQHLESIVQYINLLHPQKVLDRGFSITRYNGKALHNASAVPPDAIIETQLANGTIYSKVIKSIPDGH